MSIQEQFHQRLTQTADNLRTIMRTNATPEVAPLALPDVDEVVEQVARVTPAGDVPGLILSGLARLAGRRVALSNVRQDINLLFKGTEQTLDQAVYSAFFAGPAAVIWGYQNLLKLAGKNPDDAFPEGTWQFYVDYALREDTARHTNETDGFDARLQYHRVELSAVDRVTAWVMAAITLLHQYPELLRNEWRERVYTYILREITRPEPDAERYARIYRDWEKQRPYRRGPDSGEKESYPAYRKRKFDRYLEGRMRELRPELARHWVEQVRVAKDTALPAYQRQMSILAYLDPGPYGETRVPLSLSQTQIGLIYQQHYYLIPACEYGLMRPPSVTTVRAQIANLLAEPDVETPEADLTPLAVVKRAAWPEMRGKLNATLQRGLTTLRFAPILINFDGCPRSLPLSKLRQTQRGVGDHPLTLFDTGESMVFDQSHIFFDGAWGAALAEIFTNEALAWAGYLSKFPAPAPSSERMRALNLPLDSSDLALLQTQPHTITEVSVESKGVNLKAIQSLRRLFQFRSDRLQLTVNDLLVLYRAIHAVTYQPDPDLLDILQELPERDAAEAALAALRTSDEGVNPAILIPVDASPRSPRDRVHPISLEVPLKELNLLEFHRDAMDTLRAYQTTQSDRASIYSEFDGLQRKYLTMLASLGALFARYKNVAFEGQTASVGTIKMLAHLPPAMQRWLNRIPDRFDVLNDLIKGREVFSNVGAVVRDSSLRRFSSAKDDNDKKSLVWGILTDANGVMHITLRDFRPHVHSLDAVGYRLLAVRLAQEYLDSYARGLNAFVQDLHQITQFSRETQLERIA
jgi:hypothetical protein